MCCLAHGELAWLFREPNTGLDGCPIILLSCFRASTSGRRSSGGGKKILPELQQLQQQQQQQHKQQNLPEDEGSPKMVITQLRDVESVMFRANNGHAVGNGGVGAEFIIHTVLPV